MILLTLMFIAAVIVIVQIIKAIGRFNEETRRIEKQIGWRENAAKRRKDFEEQLKALREKHGIDI